MLNNCGRVVPPISYAPQRTRETDGGTQKKGRLRCHKRPKSGEETPKVGSDSASEGGLGVATA